MPRTNAENVRTYYGRNKNLVHFRKAMNRCRESGAVPNASTMRKYEIPLTALLVAFGEWAGTTWDVCRVQQQHCRLTQLRVELGPVRKTDFVDPTPDERKALTYLRRFSHPLGQVKATNPTGIFKQDIVPTRSPPKCAASSQSTETLPGRSPGRFDAIRCGDVLEPVLDQ